MESVGYESTNNTSYELILFIYIKTIISIPSIINFNYVSMDTFNFLQAAKQLKFKVTILGSNLSLLLWDSDPFTIIGRCGLIKTDPNVE